MTASRKQQKFDKGKNALSTRSLYLEILSTVTQPELRKTYLRQLTFGLSTICSDDVPPLVNSDRMR